jgi:hypothetical protein
MDVMIVGVLAWVAFGLAVLARASTGRQRARSLGRFAVTALALGCLLAVWFLLGWGLNYRRARLVDHLDYDEARVTTTRLEELAAAAVRELNAGHAPAHAGAWPRDRALVARLAPGFARARAMLGLPRRIVPGRPKSTLLGFYFRAAGVSGFTNPFQLEVMITPDALPFEQPGLLAHEWAHLAGLAHETEAEFAGWVICLAGDDAQGRYSGWLGLLPRLLSALPAEARRRTLGPLGEGPRADYRAIDERLRRVRPVVRDAAWASYDRFLRANRVAEGVRSYDAVTRLVAGTIFDGAWQPRLRSGTEGRSVPR